MFLRFATAAPPIAETAMMIGAQERTLAHIFLAWVVAFS